MTEKTQQLWKRIAARLALLSFWIGAFTVAAGLIVTSSCTAASVGGSSGTTMVIAAVLSFVFVVAVYVMLWNSAAMRALRSHTKKQDQAKACTTSS